MRGNIVVLFGSSHPDLAREIVKRLGVRDGQVSLGYFANKETRVNIGQSVREMDVFIVQTGFDSVNNNLMELLIMIHACKIASAAQITAVLPCFPYSRHLLQPYRKPYVEPLSEHQASLLPLFLDGSGEIEGYRTWSVRSGTLVANMISAAGADHVITMDLHNPQFQGFFDIPVDNLPSLPLMTKYIRAHIPDYHNAVVVSPDAGGAKRATEVAGILGIDFALIHGYKDRHCSRLVLVGSVAGRNVIMIDDMTDTSDTLTQAAAVLAENRAKGIFAVITHGVFSGDALDLVHRSPIDQVIVSNSVPQTEHMRCCSKFQTFDVAPMFAEAIRRIHNGESVSYLFKPEVFE